MNAEISLLCFFGEYGHIPVESAEVGGGVRIERLNEEWYESLKQQNPLVQARASLDRMGRYTHRLYIKIDPATSSRFDFTESELQPLLKAVALSHIVKPTAIAVDNVKVKTIYEDDRTMSHHSVIGNSNMSIAFVSQNQKSYAINKTDCEKMVSLWSSLSEILDDSNTPNPKYARIVRALKNFEYAHYIYFANLSYLAYHAALEFLIYFGSLRPRQNRTQIAGRLPLLLPGLVSPKDASNIYDLNLHYKHGPEPSGPFVLASVGSEVLRLTALLRESLRQLLFRALAEREFADVLSDHNLMIQKYGVQGIKGVVI